MTKLPGSTHSPAPHRPIARGFGDELADKAGDFLPLFDFGSLLLAGYLAMFVCVVDAAAGAWTDLHRLTWVAAAIAPFILYEHRFAIWAGAGDKATLARDFARRFCLFLLLIGAIAFAGRWLEGAPGWWLAWWLSTTMLLTATSRVLLAAGLRHLSRRGVLIPRGSDPGGPLPPGGHIGEWLPVTLLADRPIKRWSAVIKSSGDFLMACLIMLMLLPLLGCIALAIRLDSRGPILFTQRRHGFNNSEFDIYKFRTMQVAAPAAGGALQQTMRGDSRVTRVGRFLRKWSLDELPQVFNVLEGTMALVGPRPHAVNMRTEQRLGHEITDAYPHRHRVRPGITGWSQINGARGATDTVEQLQRRITLDLYYVEHWSPMLDLKILTLTFREVLRATNAY